MRRVDTISGICAVAIHAVIALILVSAPPPKAHSSTTVDIEIKKTPPPPKPLDPVTPPEPPKPEPERKVIEKIKVAPAPVASPLPPKESPTPPPKEPVKTVYEVKEVMESDDPSAVGVRQGINGDKLAHPVVKGPSVPLPSGTGTPGPPQPSYKPVSDIYVKKMPEIDNEACGRFVQYPTEAQEAGIEGDVEFRVALDENGKVHEIKLLKGLGHGLDEAAMHALKYKCKFSPAIGTDGKPVAYVISKYTWNFELPR